MTVSVDSHFRFSEPHFSDALLSYRFMQARLFGSCKIIWQRLPISILVL